MTRSYTPGDVLLVNDFAGSGDLLGQLIRAGERTRYGNSDYARWTHSAMIVSADGDIVEALSQGIVRSNISKYAAVETLVVSPPVPYSDPRRAYAVRFAEAQVGTRYDVIDFVSLALSLLTGWEWSLHSDTRFICSGLCARATESYTDHGYPFPSEAMMPADLGDFYGALSGQPLPPPTFLGRLLDKVRALARAISPF